MPDKNILYLSSSCPEPLYEKLIGGGSADISLAAYRFSVLMADGLSALPGANVSRVVTNTIRQKLEPFMTGNEDYGKSGWVFLKLQSGRLKYARYAIALLKYIGEQKKSNRDTVILCDALVKTFSLACMIAKPLFGVKTVAVVTDLPQYFDEHRPSLKKKLLDRLSLFAINRFSAYVILTEPMNMHANKKNRPFKVIEGFCDARMIEASNSPELKYPKKVCIYAGTIELVYNVAELVKAFEAINRDDCELHVYGGGQYKDEVASLISSCKRVKYMGVKPNSEILKAELKATLMINPRPTKSEYTKYSFPSKTLEYMASGTPLLTTRLPGIPEEYFPYVYFIDDETTEGMTRALSDLLSRPPEELHSKGMRAREFVLNEKNNVVQAKKIYALLESL